MMNWIDYLISAHAGFGALALLAGFMAISVKKGGKIHRKTGIIFFYSMLVSAFIALVVSALPEHENPFLFSIGIFSSYFLISGYRSLRFKNKETPLNWDRLLAWVIIFTGFGMITFPIYFYGVIHIVLTVFGVASILFGYQDLRLFRNRERLQKSWLTAHLGKMMGGYISAVTAFVVVNELLPGIWAWFGPSIPGTVFIVYWIRKVGAK